MTEKKFFLLSLEDERKTIQLLFEKGYEPLVCPNKRRSGGYYRKKFSS